MLTYDRDREVLDALTTHDAPDLPHPSRESRRPERVDR